ncbi:MAG: aspartate carbamoyltransferase [Candidatus Doudnabacteria bacterium RIFCSPHIGHO2_02_FULL_48_21]|uniref:Aspartate carbamoyltransferase n=1 Tax=Candidatus Doudnabacteria bacterium RIFCSPLOWO2_02_FULL_48_13 TaxID=1817845 RepID=A0A1F5Q8N2_9BACT|nr:MAG: aspartate carbamoyltransferase [Candidatus Doudnabacteria bacterium RIFCSPHIGHO2_01_48_18]OGE79842.1 MAG: aspartate carbamoyltransferase [Candidatus Doudnabacteria bacterium RIFCSPHIGHO2_01_FULL_48_180]OGE91381.1 MAG: aspartate carbamoyltransferase [Candidatus Doudnabacteria bacterium RIFCSPHIGHO2_12_FULL_47_25]OGE93193.1 MAG: aspartate carbamoyltransferase [Candidatus Doudnabacteria bacterium RIFCSPHIGHO2_02_FULL_48_21]OGE96714.1 MAG: aspartate carbamoyltransferase [Candidatus Doudnaba
MKHILKAEQFTDVAFVDKLCESAEKLRAEDGKGKILNSLEGKIVATLFFEPSTRTRLSFEAAAQKLGAKIVSTENAMHSTKAAAGEALPDIIRIVNQYADAIVFRHPEIGSAEIAASVSEAPLINAGDGAGQHPTQALGDIYTLKKEFGKIEGLKIAMAGDLKFGRTVHSLLPMISLYKDVSVYLVSPPQLRFPEEYKKPGIKFEESENLDAVLDTVDVLYVTRVQKERFASEAEYLKLKGSYVVDKASLSKMKKDAIIMHPLPRIDEIAPEVDSDPRAAYFRQAKNGLYMRMALLQELLAKN